MAEKNALWKGARKVALLQRLALPNQTLEAGFDRLTRLAAKIIGAPVAMVSFVDHERQFIKGAFSMDDAPASERQAPLSHSLCRYVVASEQPLILEDARQHPLTEHHPAVVELGIVAYAGVPLCTSQGLTLGSFCVIDHIPHAWTPEDVAALHDLAALATDLIEGYEAQNLYEAIVTYTPVVTYTAAVDTNMPALSVSPQIETLLGFTPEEWIADPERWIKQMHPDDRPHVLASLEESRAGELVRAEYRLLARDGQVRWFHDESVLVSSEQGQPLFYQGVMIDITDRVAAEEDRLASEMRYRTFFQHIPAGQLLATPEGDIVAANPALCQMLGYSEAMLRAMPLDQLPHPDDQLVTREQLRQMQTGHVTGFDMEMRLRHAQGQSIAVRGTAVLLRDHQHQPRSILALFQDISSQKEAEAALAHFTNGLQTMTEIVGQLSKILNPTRLIDEARTLIRTRYALDQVRFYLANESGQALVLAHPPELSGAAFEPEAPIPIDAADQFVAQAARSPQLLVDHPTQGTHAAGAAAPGVRCAARLLASGPLLGVIEFWAHPEQGFLSSDLKLLQMLTERIATVLENARLFEQVGRNLEETSVRLRASEALAEASTEQDVLDTILDQASFCQDARVMLLVSDPAAPQLTFVVHGVRRFASGLPAAFEPGDRFVVNDLILGHFISAKGPFRSENMLEDARIDADLRDIQRQFSGDIALHHAIIPLSVGNEWVGALSIVSRTADALDDRMVRLLESLAEQGSVALHTVRLHHKTEEARAAAERERSFLAGVLAHLPIGVYVVDLWGNVLHVNQKAKHISGCGEEQGCPGIFAHINNMIRTETGHPAPVTEFPLIRTLADGQPHSASNICLQHPDGTLIHLLTHAGPILDQSGQMIGAVATIEDISAAKDAEERLRQSEARYRAFLEASPDMMFRLSGDGYYLDYKAHAMEDFLAPPETIIGQRVYDLVPPGVGQKMQDAMQQAINSEQMQTLEYELHLERGVQDFEARIIASGPNEVLAIVRNITPRKEVERELNTRNRELESLYRLSKIALTPGRLHEIVQEIVMEVSQSTGFPMTSLEFFDAKRRVMIFGDGCSSPALAQLGAFEIPVNETLSGLVALSGQTLVETNVRDHPGHKSPLLQALHIQTLVCAPIVIDQQVIGTLSLRRSDRPRIDQRFVQWVNSLANSIAGLIERKRAEETQIRLVEILEATPDLVGIATAKGEILYLNRAGQRLLGIAENEKVKAMQALSHVPTWVQSILKQEVPPALQQDGIWSGETALVNTAGEEIPISQVILGHKNANDVVEYYSTVARDISSQKNSEDLIRRAKLEWEATFDAVSDLIAVTDLEGRIIRCNRAVTQALKTPYQYLIGEPIEHIFLGPPTPEQHLLRERTGPVQFVRFAGWFEISHYPVQIDQHPYGIVYIIKDITDRKRAEDALKQSAQDYRGLFENAHDAIVIFAPEDETVLEVNPRACELYGYTRDEFIGLSLRHISKDPTHGDRQVQQTLAQGHYHRFESVQYRRDGHEMQLEINAAVVTYQEQKAILSINRDVSDRKRSEEILRESAAFNRSILNSLLANIAVIDRAGRIIAVNESWQEFAKANRGIASELTDIGANYLEVCEKAVGDFSDEAPMVLQGLRQVLEAKQQQFNLEYPCHSPHEKRWFMMRATPLLSREGGAVIAHINVTDRKEAEQQVARAERLAALGRLAAALAHEINNPLQAIRSYLDLILDFPLDQEEREGYLQIVRQEIEHLSEGTKRILNFARPTPQPRRLLVISELVQQTLALAGKQLQHAHVEVTTVLDPALMVFGAPDQLTQVFLNMVLNAVEAMPHGGSLHVETKQIGAKVLIEFVNSGTSIPSENLAHIFEPFFTTKGEGSGLGLSISQTLIEQHHGHITVGNLVSGNGVIFTITLPQAIP